MLHRTLPALLLLAACQSTQPQQQSPPQAPPADVAELIGRYASTSGFDLTYDQGTAELLASLAITTVGPEQPGLLRVALSEAASEQQPEAVQLELIGLQHASAEDLAGTLSDLVRAASRGGRGSTVRVVADARTNSLLVLAPADTLQQVRNLVAHLDREVPPGS